MIRFLILLLVLLAPRLCFAAPNPTTPLSDFMRDRKGFSWIMGSRGRDVTTLEITSQTWKDSTWKHRVVIYQPTTLLYPDAAAMFLTTQYSTSDDAIGRFAADAIGAPFVIVYDMPKEPLWNRTGDELLSYTMGKALETGDADWSLAFPMAKAAVRAMDAVDVYNATSREPETRDISRWLQIGFARRGMAAWLAATDRRVKGLVSISYNGLNATAQAQAQRADWGELAPHSETTIEESVKATLKAPRFPSLLETWDPYSFRAQLDKPKLVINATGDDYSSLRAFDQYADALPGVTNLLMVPGTDHDMANSFDQVFGVAMSWCQWTLGTKPLPQPKLTRQTKSWSLDAPGAQAANLHWAWSKNNDFRNAQWQTMPMRKTSGGTFEGSISEAPADQNNIAVFALGNWVDGKLTLPMGSRVVIDKK